MKVINNSDVARLVSQDEVTRTLETAYQENYITIGNSRYSPEPYLKINRYTMDVFYNDHQMNDHNGKCIKLKKKL